MDEGMETMEIKDLKIKECAINDIPVDVSSISIKKHLLSNMYAMSIRDCHLIEFKKPPCWDTRFRGLLHEETTVHCLFKLNSDEYLIVKGFSKWFESEEVQIVAINIMKA